MEIKSFNVSLRHFIEDRRIDVGLFFEIVRTI